MAPIEMVASLIAFDNVSLNFTKSIALDSQ